MHACRFIEEFLPGSDLESVASSKSWQARGVYALRSLIEEGVLVAETEGLAASEEENSEGVRCPFRLFGVSDCAMESGAPEGLL